MNSPITGRWFKFSLRTAFLATAMIGLATWCWLQYLDQTRGVDWQEFSPSAIRTANSNGHAVVVSFLADWDMSTAMPHVLIDTPSVRRLLRSKGVIAMRADYTNPERSPQVRQELEALGRNSIPVVAIYPASGGEPIIVGQGGSITAEQLAAEIEKL